MKQTTISQLYLLTKNHDAKFPSKAMMNFRFKNMIYKFSLLGIMLFAFTGFSYAQNSMNKNVAYRNNLLKEKRDIIDKLRTERKELHEVRKFINKVTVPSSTLALFKSHFPKAKNVSWTQTDGYYEADYKLNKAKEATFYDYNNTLMGTGKYVSYHSLPYKGRKFIAQKYKGYKPEKVMYYDDNDQNSNNLNFFGSDIDHDDYFAMMTKGKKEIVLQITPDGDVSYFSNLS